MKNVYKKRNNENFEKKQKKCVFSHVSRINQLKKLGAYVKRCAL